MSEQAGGTLMLFSFERPRASWCAGFSVDAAREKGAAGASRATRGFVSSD